MNKEIDTTQQPIRQYEVSLLNRTENYTPRIVRCAYNYLSSMAVFTILLGLFILGTSIYIYDVNEFNLTYGSELCLIISGGTITFVSIFLWISICNYTNAFAKVALLLFSIFSFGIFMLSAVTTIYSTVYFESNGIVNNSKIDKLMNDTLYQAYDICCTDTNSSSVLEEVCYDILGHNQTFLNQECSSFNRFEGDFYAYIHVIFKWILIAGSITAFVNLITGITSCCLMSAYKKIYYYKNNEALV